MEEGQRKGARERELFEIKQQMSLRYALSYDLPHRSFDQRGRKFSGKTAALPVRHMKKRSKLIFSEWPLLMRRLHSKPLSNQELK